MKAANTEYVWLGSYRFLLAVLVYVAHASGIWNTYHGLIGPGALGVFLFFTVSGYVIVAALETFYSGRYWSFLANRALRIYPVFWACYFLAMALMFLHGTERLGGHGAAPNIDMGGIGLASLLRGISIIGGYFDRFALGPNAPAWSIITELYFYLAAAGAPLVLGRWLGQRRALWLAGAVSLVLAALVWLTEGSFRFYGTMSFAPFFVAGGAHWYLRHRQGGPGARVLLAAALAGCIVFLLSADSYKLGSLSLSDVRRTNQTLAFVALYALFALCVALRMDRPVLARIDRFIGDLTYPFYLCHVPVLAVLWHNDSGMRGPAPFIASFVICGVVAYIIRLVIEEPMVRFRDVLRGQRLTQQ
jgi:peptidoglycan/LPS O-acetylase OafA/YrhL